MKLSINAVVLWSQATRSIPIFGGGKQHAVRLSALPLSHKVNLTLQESKTSRDVVSQDI